MRFTSSIYSPGGYASSRGGLIKIDTDAPERALRRAGENAPESRCLSHYRLSELRRCDIWRTASAGTLTTANGAALSLDAYGAISPRRLTEMLFSASSGRRQLIEAPIFESRRRGDRQPFARQYHTPEIIRPTPAISFPRNSRRARPWRFIR